MADPSKRRRSVTLRLSPEGYEAVRDLAHTETASNMSWMIRKLLAEALAARGKKAS